MVGLGNQAKKILVVITLPGEETSLSSTTFKSSKPLIIRTPGRRDLKFCMDTRMSIIYLVLDRSYCTSMGDLLWDRLMQDAV